MRIVVNDIAASKTGALSVLKDFYHYIAEYDTENEWFFLLGGNYVEETKRIHVCVLPDVKKSRFSRLKFDFFTGAGYLRSLKPDIVFSLQNTLTYGYHGKQAVYVHQPLGFQKVKKFSFFDPKEREYAVYQYVIGAMIDSAVRRSDLTILACTDRNTDIRELLTEEADCGLWCASDDEEAFCENVERLCRDEGLREQLGNNGRRYLEEHFDVSRSVGLIEQYGCHNKKETMEGRDDV